MKVLSVVQTVLLVAVFGLLLLARPAQLGVVSGPYFTIPAVFDDTVALNGETTLGNCATKASVIIPAIGGTGAPSLATDAGYATSVTVTGLAVGDVVLPTWSPGNATNTLQDLKLTLSGNASSANTAVIFFKNYAASSSAESKAGTLKVCYFD